MFASSERESADILICLEGKGTLDDLSGSDRLPVQKGQSVFVPAAVSQYCIMGDVTLYKASVPT
jgi:mannose-6-phosphate isomerase class I